MLIYSFPRMPCPPGFKSHQDNNADSRRSSTEMTVITDHRPEPKYDVVLELFKQVCV